MARRWIAAALGVALGSALLAAPAVAGPPPATRIKFKLDAHEFTAGTAVTGSVNVLVRDGNAWVPLNGGTLLIEVDGVHVLTLTTDQDGHALVSYPGAEVGDHVMNVVFGGDGTNPSADRAHRFSVTGTSRSATVPDPPTLLSADGSTGVVMLTWSPPANDGGSPITGYNVYRGDQGSDSEVLLVMLPVQTDYLDETVISIEYHYVVTAVNAVGESLWSNEFSVTPA